MIMMMVMMMMIMMIMMMMTTMMMMMMLLLLLMMMMRMLPPFSSHPGVRHRRYHRLQLGLVLPKPFSDSNSGKDAAGSVHEREWAVVLSGREEVVLS